MSSNILDRIVLAKKRSLEELKKTVPLKKVISQCTKAAQVPSFIDSISISGEVSIIAEMKKRSPSAGELVRNYNPAKIAKIYKKCGARAISVLTEEDHFHGSSQHLVTAKKAAGLPILRKDFIFDPYQIYESKVLGASAILLIVAILGGKIFSELIHLSRALNIDALVEVHSMKELEIALKEKPKLVGINNRNLKDLSVNIETTFKLARQIQGCNSSPLRGEEKGEGDITIVAESGIKSPETIKQLKSAGISAALIGESILKSREMSKTLKSFVNAAKTFVD